MNFTFGWAFNKESDWEFFEKISCIFRSEGTDIYFVELEPSVEERLKRNQTPNRLEQKSTKRNIKQLEENLLSSMDTLRLNSEAGEITEENYLRVDNTKLSAAEVAKMIQLRFCL
ncbi:hypothetical protein MUB24_14200 [Lederbergia sp. NSJ-179]|uniref:hypothetical protein n=1 Tax=Lederbergia sp. NSJ-179 TaxID=2931402 RepID=UPI001FD1E55A|nr:hypothetical protein [Lederbergia sp. NSJ-179]MCJ7842032.1 hypothetical protein [Lederbergia sp. NSJ-179]